MGHTTQPRPLRVRPIHPTVSHRPPPTTRRLPRQDHAKTRRVSLQPYTIRQPSDPYPCQCVQATPVGSPRLTQSRFTSVGF